MPHSYIIGLSALAILFPFAFSLLIALKPAAKPTSIADYFLYKKKLDAGSFVTSSVGYSTQVASIFLFLYWFFQYGLSSLFVPVAWGLGYIMVAHLVKRGSLDTFLGETPEVETLHGFIGRRFSAKGRKLIRPLIMIAAISTLFGFGGSLTAEIDYATRYFLLPALGLPTDQSGTTTLIIAQLLVLSFSGCYVLWGGYKAAVMTDQFQIYVAYGSFTVLALIMGIYATFTSHSIAAVLCTLAIGYFLFAFYRRRRAVHEVEPNYTEFTNDRRMFFILILATLAVFIAQVILLSSGQMRPYDPALLPPKTGDFFGFGVFGVLSLLIANFFWQLIDLSCLQRLQSVEFHHADKLSRQRLVVGLTTSGFESFGIWVLTIVFAVLVKALAGNYDTVSTLLLNLPYWNFLLLPMLCFLVVAFMISTLACFISASAFVTYYDIVPIPKRDAISEGSHSNLHVPRFLTLCILLGNFILYWLLQQFFNSQTGQVLYGFYSLQASIFVVVLVALFWPRLASPVAGIVAMIAGWCLGFWTAISPSPWFGISANSWAVIPPLASVAASFASYGIVIIVEMLITKDDVTKLKE